MSPPSFSEFGKEARDLLNKKFYLGVLNFKYSSKVDTLGISANVEEGFKAQKIFSDLEGKWKVPDFGLTITNKWASSNAINSELLFEDKLYPGTKQSFKLSRDPFNDSWHASIKNSLKNKSINAELEMFFRSAIPNLSPSFTIGYQNYLAGAELQFDSTNKTLEKANFGIGYAVQDFAFHGLISNWGKRFTANLFQRVTDRLQLAGTISWNRMPDEISWSVGTQYTLDEEQKHAIKTKLDNQTRISVSLVTYLTQGFQFTLSGLFNGPDVPRIGMGFEWDSETTQPPKLDSSSQ